MPTKKSSGHSEGGVTRAVILSEHLRMNFKALVKLTWNYFDEMRAPVPYIRSVIDDHDHALIHWEQPLE